MKKLKNIIFLITIFSMTLNSEVKILDRVAVIVDDGVIMESQITNAINTVIQQYKEENIQPPSDEIIKNEMIEKLIIDELQLQLADRAGIKISDAELNETFIRIAKNNQMELEEFINYINSQGEQYEDLREDIRRQMLIQRVQQGRVSSEVQITDKEFQSFLETDDSIKTLEPEILLGQILVVNKIDAEKIKTKIQEKQKFEDLAKEYSQGKSASNGGLLEWKKPSDMPTIFAEAIKNKDKNWISEPLESGAGYHILKIIDKRGNLVKFEDQWNARHILMIPTTIRSNEATYQALEEVRKKILDGEDFETVANEFSEDPGSANNGGNLGWAGKGKYAKEFEETMIETEIGVISEIFETQFGYHFLEVLDKRNKDLTKDLIEDRAYNILFSRKYDEALENSLRTMRAEAFVEIKALD